MGVVSLFSLGSSFITSHDYCGCECVKCVRAAVSLGEMAKKDKAAQQEKKNEANENEEPNFSDEEGFVDRISDQGKFDVLIIFAWLGMRYSTCRHRTTICSEITQFPHPSIS